MIRPDLLIEVCTAMATTLDRPANPPPPPRPDRHSEFSTASRPPALPPAPPERRTNWLHRYQSHLLIAGISVIATATEWSMILKWYPLCDVLLSFQNQLSFSLQQSALFFQTIHLSTNVRLCDSPGLVFPSLLPNQLQVLTAKINYLQYVI